MERIDDLFRAIGGPTKFGRIIGKSPEHAGAMKARRSVPVRYWPSLISSETGKAHGLTYDTLVKIHANEKSASGDASTQAAE